MADTGLTMQTFTPHINKEKTVWDERARTIQHDVEVRGPLNNPQESATQICSILQKSVGKNLLLDVGCGNGLFTIPLTNIFDFVVGIDFSKGMIKRCKAKIGNLNFIVASATHLPLRDNLFDAVMCVSVLQFLHSEYNLEKVLKEILRISAQNSFVFLSFPDEGNMLLDLVKNIVNKERSIVKRIWFYTCAYS